MSWGDALAAVGGAAGAVAGTQLNTLLAERRQLLTRLFAAVVILAGLYVGVRGLSTLIA